MILYFNVDSDISNEIDSIVKSKGKEYTSVFMSWISTKKGTDQKKASALLKQTEILEKYVKKLPIVIFDRYRSMTTEEYNWLRKFKVTFFEPAIHPRDGFKYLPNWTKIKTIEDIELNDTKRSVNLGYIGSLADKTKSFDKYYVKPKLSHDIKVSYYSKNVPDKDYLSLGIASCPLTFNDIEFTVVIGNVNDYATGHLDQYYFEALNNNCIPLLPMENRYYSSLPYTINTETWYDMYSYMYDGIYIGMIKDIYDRIKKYYPEMNIKFTADVIKKYLYENS